MAQQAMKHIAIPGGAQMMKAITVSGMVQI